MPGKRNFVSYIKEAFLNRWNLLVFGGAVAAAFISGYPEALLPVVAAGEIAYLAFLSTNKRFQWVIEARANRGQVFRDALGPRSSDLQRAHDSSDVGAVLDRSAGREGSQ